MPAPLLLQLRRGATRARVALARVGSSALLLSFVALTACGGGDKTTGPSGNHTPPDGTPTDPNPVPTGIISVHSTGLPAGVNSRVVVRNGTSEYTLLGASSVAGLAPGSWTATASSVSAEGVTYDPTPVTQTVIVAGSATSVVNVAYAPNVGSMVVTISGLPTDVGADVSISGPDGFSKALTATATLPALTSGTYHIDARSVRGVAGSYVPTAASQDLVVAAGNTPAVAAVAYAPAPAVVNVAVDGLPGGSSAAITLTPPSGAQVPVTNSARISPAAAGSWHLAASPVKFTGFTWSPTPVTADSSVSAGDSVAFHVQYALSTGAIAVAVSGLPPNSDGAVIIAGPNGFSRLVTATSTVTDLAPGNYTVTTDSVRVGGVTYRVFGASQQVTVVASLVASPVTVSYSAAVATFVVAITGLPIGVTNSVQVTGPGGFNQVISGTTVFSNVTPGTYSVVAQSIVLPGNVHYEPTPTSLQRTLAVGARDSVRIAFAKLGGTLAVTVAGLPSGASAAVQLVGATDTFQVTGSGSLNLNPGSYTLLASPVQVGSTVYTPSPTSIPVNIAINATTSATVTYTPPAVGSLALTVTGLPAAVNAAITLSGVGPTITLLGSGTVNNLAVGSYTLTASPVTSGGVTYNPTPTNSAISITLGATKSATVTYTAVVVGGTTFNLVVDGFYLTQAIQKMDGSVPLVAGRDALLRVFVHASEANSQTPPVRVRIYDGASLLQTTMISAPESSVRLSLAEGTYSSTWNLLVSGANVRPALRVLVDADPNSAIAESDESDNMFPRSGTPQSMTVNTVPVFNVRFVPVVVGVLTGNVTVANKDQFLVTARRIHPILDVSSDIRIPFTSSASDLQSGDANGNWLTVLSEMNALRTADGAPSTTHYFGVVKVSYSSGIAGYGYVPGRAAIGWDYLPSGDGVAAHEWGHNFSRPHTPCGGVAGADASYPYAGGTIGSYGWNPSTGTLVPPTYTDIMGYCANQWTSDWTWTKVMTYRASSGFSGSVAGVKIANVAGEPAVQDGLLVWGRIINGRVLLEPAFRVRARPSAVASVGSHRLQALDANGTPMLDIPFDAQVVDHVTGRDERHFAVVIPWSDAMERSLATLRVRDVRQPLFSASRSSASAIAMFAPSAQRGTAATVTMPEAATESMALGAGRTRIQWNAEAYSMVMARDAATGEIMGFLRHSGDALLSQGRAMELVLSDGVRSRVERVR